MEFAAYKARPVFPRAQQFQIVCAIRSLGNTNVMVARLTIERIGELLQTHQFSYSALMGIELAFSKLKKTARQNRVALLPFIDTQEPILKEFIQMYLSSDEFI